MTPIRPAVTFVLGTLAALGCGARPSPAAAPCAGPATIHVINDLSNDIELRTNADKPAAERSFIGDVPAHGEADFAAPPGGARGVDIMMRVGTRLAGLTQDQFRSVHIVLQCGS